MNYLPVPPLAQTMARYLEIVRPLLSRAEFSTTAQAVADFEERDGRACQRELIDFSHQQNDAGGSWLSDAWLASYLLSRGPLPLTSNVGFQLAWPLSPLTAATSVAATSQASDIAGATEAGSGGLDWAAGVVQQLAESHLRYLRGDITSDINARGVPLCMQQWRYLAGGVRRPGLASDEYDEGPLGAAFREILVLWQGRMVFVPVSDADGVVASRTKLREAIARIVQMPAAEQDATQISYLNREVAASILDELLNEPHNAATYQRLSEAMLVVYLDADDSDKLEQLRQTTYGVGKAWADKPVTYGVRLADASVWMHIEHTIVDGATIKSTIERAHSIEPLPGSDAVGSLSTAGWVISDAQAEQLARAAADYQQTASDYQVRVVTAPWPTVPTARVSHDACQQFAILYAQLATFARLRSTYESVDMREYQAGRTECLRPNSPQAVELVHSLLAGNATKDQLAAAFDAHRASVKICKSGQDIDRHLQGLRLMAQRLGLEPQIFADAGYRRLTTDFLSTTSLGDQASIVRYAFAPSVAEGIGVNYSVVNDGYEFCLNYRASQAAGIDDFADALARGVDAVWRLIES